MAFLTNDGSYKGISWATRDDDDGDDEAGGTQRNMSCE